MKKNENTSDSAYYRHKAEEQLKKKTVKTGSKLSEVDTLKLVHELEVHQIELELQNEELILAKEKAEVAAEKFTELFDFAPTGYFILSKEGVIKESNHIGSQMLGKNRSQLLKSSLGFIVSDDTKPIFNRFFEKIFVSNTKESCEVIFSSEGNEPRVIHLTGIVHNNGAQCFITAIDISERKQAEEALRNSEIRFRLLVENLKVGILLQGPQSEMLMSNPRALELLDLTEDQLIGKTSFDPSWNVIHEDGSPFPGPTHPVPQAIATRQAVRNIVMGVYRPKPNNRVWLLVDAEPLLNADGTVMQVICTFTDITARKMAQDALVKSESLLNATQFIAKIGGWEYDVERQEMTWTDETYAIHEFDKKDFRPNSMDHIKKSIECYDVLDRSIIQKAFDRCVEFGESYNVEFPFTTAKGKKMWIQTTGRPNTTDGKITTIAGNIIDITERKNTELALRNAQKLESIGTLAGGIAHDFNNLMNAVLGQTSLALHKLPKESPASAHITKAIKAPERVADLTKQLLAYSGKGKFMVDEIDLNTLVNENVQILEVSIPKTTKLRYELGSPSPHIKGDISQIQQVIMNLIINAGEAMDPNPGTIIVHTGRIEISKETSEYSKYTSAPLSAGSYTMLSVKDSGSGIGEETLTRIFDPFFTTKFTGRGLGLAAVLGIIKGHKGGLRIETEVGKGTTFEIVFPFIDPSKTTDVSVKKELSAINGEGKTILVIDDEASVIELLEDVLPEVNFKVLGALDPLKGIEIYRRDHKNISLVVLDFSMPNMDGKATFEELLKVNNDVKVLLCSGYSEEETLSVFGNDRPTGYFQKPYKTDALIQLVAEIVSKDR